MELNDFLKKLRVGVLEDNYENLMVAKGVSPCSSAYAIEILLNCSKKIWEQDMSAEQYCYAIVPALEKKDYYAKMKSINVGKKNADYALSLMLGTAKKILSAAS